MSDRMDRLLKLHAQQVDEDRRRLEMAADAKRTAQEREAEVRALWHERRGLVDQALGDLNDRTRPNGLEFTCSTAGDPRASEVAVLTIRSKPGMHKGILTVDRNGSVRAVTNSENMAPWHQRTTSIENLSAEFCAEFMADVLEAKLAPTKRPSA